MIWLSILIIFTLVYFIFACGGSKKNKKEVVLIVDDNLTQTDASDFVTDTTATELPKKRKPKKDKGRQKPNGRQRAEDAEQTKVGKMKMKDVGDAPETYVHISYGEMETERMQSHHEEDPTEYQTAHGGANAVGGTKWGAPPERTKFQPKSQQSVSRSKQSVSRSKQSVGKSKQSFQKSTETIQSGSNQNKFNKSLQSPKGRASIVAVAEPKENNYESISDFRKDATKKPMDGPGFKLGKLRR